MPTRERRRADAERSVAAILHAAVQLLAERPEASMSDIAAAAGVVRQTVYAHYDSRAGLFAAAAARAPEHPRAATDPATPDEGSPERALERLIDAWWQSVEPY